MIFSSVTSDDYEQMKVAPVSKHNYTGLVGDININLYPL
jgi:hypothetical protein